MRRDGPGLGRFWGLGAGVAPPARRRASETQKRKPRLLFLRQGRWHFLCGELTDLVELLPPLWRCKFVAELGLELLLHLRIAEHSDLPSDLGSDETGGRGRRRAKRKKRTAPKISERETRKAAADFETEQKRRDVERRREEAAMAKQRERREKQI